MYQILIYLITTCKESCPWNNISPKPFDIMMMNQWDTGATRKDSYEKVH